MNSEILNGALVNYDALAERMSALLNRQFYTYYLLHTLQARATASGYLGFAKFFDIEIETRSFLIRIIKREILEQDKEMKFNQIDAIPNRGSKLIDLINIYEDCINKNKQCLCDLISFASQDPAMKIAISGIVDTCDERNQIKVVSKIKKMLSKAVNNYVAILMIDKLLKEEYSQF